MAAWVGAGSALVGALGGVANTLTRNNQQPQQKLDVSLAALRDAENNSDYQRAISALINKRSIAGTSDSFGSSVQYDPATNTWRSVLGPQPTAVQTASDLASISRNTTDLRQAQQANELATARAGQAAPAADTAIRELQSFKPMSSDELAGLLQQTSTNASNATFRPLVADTLRSFARNEQAAGPALAELGRTSYNALRDSMAKNRIDALTGTDEINTRRRAGLETGAANAYTLATPQYQYPGVNTSTGRDTLANLVAARSQRAGVDPAYGAGGVNTAQGQVGSAFGNVASNIPGQPPNTLADVGKELGKLGQNSDIQKVISGLIGGGNSDLSKSSTMDQGYQLAQGLQLGNDQVSSGSYWPGYVGGFGSSSSSG